MWYILYQGLKPHRLRPFDPSACISNKPVLKSTIRFTVNKDQRMKTWAGQGRSQPHSPGWARFPLSIFFLKFWSIWLIFPPNVLIYFLILALRVGEYPGRPWLRYWSRAKKKTHLMMTLYHFLSFTEANCSFARMYAERPDDDNKATVIMVMLMIIPR